MLFLKKTIFFYWTCHKDCKEGAISIPDFMDLNVHFIPTSKVDKAIISCRQIKISLLRIIKFRIRLFSARRWIYFDTHYFKICVHIPSPGVQCPCSLFRGSMLSRRQQQQQTCTFLFYVKNSCLNNNGGWIWSEHWRENSECSSFLRNC